MRLIPGGPGRRRPRLLHLVATLLLMSSSLLALPEEDRTYLNFLIKVLRYYDVAERYMDRLEKSGNLDQNDQAEIASNRIDALKAQGKQAEAVAAIEKFKKRFPSHARSSLGNLEAIGVSLKKVLDSLDAATVEPDKAKAEALRKDASKMFLESISKPLDALITDLQSQVNGARKPAAGPRGAGDSPKPTPKTNSPESMTLLRSLQYTELNRLKFLLEYARKLPESDSSRMATLERGQKLAEEFVNAHAEFPLMQFEAQLHIGLYAFARGRHAAAEDALGVLYDLDPPFARPYAKELVVTFLSIRLQSVLFGARAMNASGNFAKSVRLIDDSFFKPRNDEFDLRKAESEPELKALTVLVRLEHGLALAGSGKLQKGLDEIQSIIRQQGLASSLVTDARKALGRLAMLGGIKLRGSDYYEAALGLKSDHNFEAALDNFQVALVALSSGNRKDLNDIAPQCLNQIGEINFILGRFVESALAFQEVCERFPNAPEELISKAATNFLNMTTRAIKTTPGGNNHTALTAMKAEATRASEKFSSSFAVFATFMSDARNLELEGKWAAARAKYLQVEPQFKGQKTPFYWRAQAKAWTCVCREWEEANEGRRKELEADITKAISQLGDITKKAIEAKDTAGAAIASLSLGNILYQRSDWKGAAEALSVFTAELAADETYRCDGMSSLILSEIKLEDFGSAGKHYAELEKNCAAQPIVASVASALSDAHVSAGHPQDAATFALRYMNHPSTKEELNKPQEVARLARIMIDGGMIKEATALVERLKAAKRDSQFDTNREVLVLESKFLQHSKDWEKAIAKLEAYVIEYKPQENKNYDDAYVLRDLAKAYLARSKSKPELKDLRAAEQAYNSACYVMKQRGERDPALEKTFWLWIEEFMQVKMALGDSGDNNAYRNIVEFIDGASPKDASFISPKLKDLAKQAAAKQAKARSQESNPDSAKP